MYPILFKIGRITIYTYGLIMAIAFLAAFSFISYEAKKEGIKTEKLVDLSFFILLSGIIGSRILYIVIYHTEYIENPLRVFKIWEGGLVFYGGVAVAIGTALFLLKRYKLPFWRMADILAAALVLGQAIGRIGCFMAGCCYGKHTHLPWAVTFKNQNTLAPINIPIHPTQLYHSFINFLIFLILIIILTKKRRFIGQIFCLYLCLYPLGRFIVEFFRDDSYRYILGPLNTTQIISMIILLCAVYLYFWRKNRAVE